MHDGIDTRFFKPNLGAKLVIPEIGLDLSEAEKIVTYATRGMEPYRGFPQFMEAAALLQKQRPNCHQDLRDNARQTVLENYDLAKLLPQQMVWLMGQASEGALPFSVTGQEATAKKGPAKKIAGKKQTQGNRSKRSAKRGFARPQKMAS